MVRIYDLKSYDGTPHAFEVENLLLSRRQTCRVAGSIPGVTLVRRPRLFGATDDFCEFTLAGETFIIEEPYGDNSRYWIGAKDPVHSASLPAVRAAFENHREWVAPLRLAGAMLALAAACVTVLAWYGR